MTFQALLERFSHFKLSTEDIQWMKEVVRKIACWIPPKTGGTEKRFTLQTEVNRRRSARIREQRERERQEQHHQPK